MCLLVGERVETWKRCLSLGSERHVLHYAHISSQLFDSVQCHCSLEVDRNRSSFDELNRSFLPDVVRRILLSLSTFHIRGCRSSVAPPMQRWSWEDVG